MNIEDWKRFATPFANPAFDGHSLFIDSSFGRDELAAALLYSRQVSGHHFFLKLFDPKGLVDPIEWLGSLNFIDMESGGPLLVTENGVAVINLHYFPHQC